MPAKDWFTLEVGEYHIWCAFVCVYVRAKKGERGGGGFGGLANVQDICLFIRKTLNDIVHDLWYSVKLNCFILLLS